MADLILALDASTTAVGWCLGWTDGAYDSSGVYLPPGKAWYERVSNFSGWLWQRLEEEDIEVVAFEKATGSHGNMHTNRLLGSVEYVIRYSCREFDLPCIDVTASQVKATGCSKVALQVAQAIKGGPLDAKHAGDEADSLGVLLAGVKVLREKQWEKL